MTRAKIDFHEDGRDAAESAAALCGVGLKPSDVAAIWSLVPGGREAAATEDSHQIDLTDVGRLGLAGWIVGELGPSGDPLTLSALEHALRDARPSGEILARVIETLGSGGGIVVVRSAGTPGAL